MEFLSALPRPVMGKLIANFPQARLTSRGDAFATIVRSIIGQQISLAAANSIWARLQQAHLEITPQNILECPGESLRILGLSGPKVNYLKNVAQHFSLKEMACPTWQQDAEEDLRQELLSIKGIGQWTVDMYNIFYRLHPDILPLTDLGLLKAAKRLYGLSEPLTKSEVQALAEQWRPWRTVATWYLWCSINPCPINY